MPNSRAETRTGHAKMLLRCLPELQEPRAPGAAPLPPDLLFRGVSKLRRTSLPPPPRREGEGYGQEGEAEGWLPGLEGLPEKASGKQWQSTFPSPALDLSPKGGACWGGPPSLDVRCQVRGRVQGAGGQGCSKMSWTCLANTAMSSLKESEEQTSPPATPGSRGVQVASSHFSKTRANRGNNGCLPGRHTKKERGWKKSSNQQVFFFKARTTYTAAHSAALN